VLANCAPLHRGAHRRKNERELDLFVRSSRVSIASIDEETSGTTRLSFTACALQAPRPDNDIWIAASAMQHGLQVITTDRHFAKIPQILREVLAVE